LHHGLLTKTPAEQERERRELATQQMRAQEAAAKDSLASAETVLVKLSTQAGDSPTDEQAAAIVEAKAEVEQAKVKVAEVTETVAIAEEAQTTAAAVEAAKVAVDHSKLTVSTEATKAAVQAETAKKLAEAEAAIIVHAAKLLWMVRGVQLGTDDGRSGAMHRGILIFATTRRMAIEAAVARGISPIANGCERVAEWMGLMPLVADFDLDANFKIPIKAYIGERPKVVVPVTVEEATLDVGGKKPSTSVVRFPNEKVAAG
jgi:hypothetical protein